MNATSEQTFGAPTVTHSILLEVERVAEMRATLHDLANVFTGMLVTSGLLAEKLQNSSESGLAQSLCELGERGSESVRHVRALLLRASAGCENWGDFEG